MNAFGRYLTIQEAEALGYTVESATAGNVRSMKTAGGYLVTYGAPSYASAVAKADGQRVKP